MKNNPKKFISAGKVGDLLGVQARTVLNWAKAEKIPAIKLPSGRFVFDPEAVTAALKKFKGESGTGLRAAQGQKTPGRQAILSGQL